MNNFLIKCLFGTSWVFSIIALSIITPLGRLFNRLMKHIIGKDLFPKMRNRSFKTKLLTASLFLIGAVWSLRFAVGYYSVFYPHEGAIPLTPMEEVFNSFVHTLQTFSLDEDYTEYITTGREMMAKVFGEGSKCVDVYGVYAAVLNLLVPVAGGAIVFEIISEFSPKMRLLFANLKICTEKYYFSELNDKSLALAKNIVDIKKSKACIIFTDAYADDDEERGAECLTKARSIGAICMKEDLMNIKYYGKAPKLFLIDGSEISNLQSLTALLEQRNKKMMSSKIYVFSDDKKYSNIDEEVSFIINRADKTDTLPTVIPVNCIRNMVCRLFDDVPLYEPLLNQEPAKEKTLTVTILGSGVIGTEFFLTTYWCGQMLDCKLHINVVSKEKQNKESISGGKDDFEGRINYINPEILKTQDPDSELLKYSDNGERNEPYFSYDYIESDILSDDFVTLMKEPELLNTDYFIVALGSDEDNLEVANKLRQIVGVHHMYNAAGKKTVISYVIYNSELCRALNKKQAHRYDPVNYDPQKPIPDIYMHAFGDLDSVYGVRNVLQEKIEESAYELKKAYDVQKSLRDAKKERKDNKNKNKRFKDIYTYQSNIAKRFHRKYKWFSAGMVRNGIFTENPDENKDADKPEKKFAEFIKAPIDKDKTVYCQKTKQQLLNELAWLEHRRWCAYMRTKGFTSPGQGMYEKYFMFSTDEHEAKNHKFISLKLHPCLVECSKKGINAQFDDRGFLISESECLKSASNDYLDELSNDRAKKTGGAEDFKHWDYPEFDLESGEISDDLICDSNPFDVAGKIDAKSVYLSGEKKYVSIGCFVKTVKERYKSYIHETKRKSDAEIYQLIQSERFNEAFNKAMDKIEIVTSKPFKGLDVEMMDYSSVNIYSNQLLGIIDSIIS